MGLMPLQCILVNILVCMISLKSGVGGGGAPAPGRAPLLIWASYRHSFHFKDRLPEGICCCLQTCSVNVVLLVMCCMCLPTFIVTSADFWVYLCSLLIYCLRLVVVVYKLVLFMDIVLHMHTNFHSHLC